MRPHPCPQNRPLLRAGLFALSVSLALSFAQTIRAADGTWNTTTSGALWSGSGNWSGSTIADGSGSTAFFNSLDIPASTVTVNLDTTRTIGNLVFGDTSTTTIGAWTLANNGSSSNVLTLAGTTPTITVNDLGTGGYSTSGGLAGSSGASTVTISAVIDGTAGLVKTGSGTVATSSAAGKGVLVLSGINTYSGGTTISSGALAAANSSALGTGAVTVANGTQLQIRGVSIANTININGGSALFSSSTSGSNLTGTVNLQSNAGAGLATNNGNCTMTLSGSLNLNGFTFTANTINTANSITISGVINGSGGITQAGNGSLLISNDNSGTYSGTTTVGQNGAVLQLGNDGALGSGSLSLNATSATLSVRSADSSDRTLANALLLGGNTSTTYSFGSSTTGNLTFTNTTGISLSSVRTFNVANAQTEFDAGFTGTGGITTKVTTSTGTLVLNGANTYTGATTINAGTVQLGNGGTTGSLSTGSAITVASGATFAVKRSNAVVQGTDFKTAISGAGGFIQAGTGTTTLADNSFTGAINVNAGTLLITGVNTSASGVSVASGGRLGGVGGSVGAVTFNTGAGLAYNIASAAQSGGLTTTGFSGTGIGSFTLYLTGAATGFDDTQNYSWAVLTSNSTDIGSVSLSGITLDTTGFDPAFTGSFNLSKDATSIYVNYAAAAIPEPSTCAMIAGAALLGFACWRRRRV